MRFSDFLAAGVIGLSATTMWFAKTVRSDDLTVGGSAGGSKGSHSDYHYHDEHQSYSYASSSSVSSTGMDDDSPGMRPASLAALLTQLDKINGDESSDEKDKMFAMMYQKSAEAIRLQASFGLDDIDALLSGQIESLHPASMTNASFSADLFGNGGVVPVASDTNGDGKISMDELLDYFFHANNVVDYFQAVKVEHRTILPKATKKAVIQKNTPVLHHTIVKVAANRGWGIQDDRFAIPVEHLDRNSPFRDYPTFIKTLRVALISPDNDDDNADNKGDRKGNGSGNDHGHDDDDDDKNAEGKTSSSS